MKKYSKSQIAFPRTPGAVARVRVRLDGCREVEGIYKQNVFLSPERKIHHHFTLYTVA
jgi:hypothetical protein